MTDHHNMSPHQLAQLYAAQASSLAAAQPGLWAMLKAEDSELYNECMRVRGNYPVTAPDAFHKEGAPLWTIAFLYRRIQVHGPIMPESVRGYRMQTHYLTSKRLVDQPKEREVIGVHYFFDSPGGSVDYGLQMFDDMSMAKNFNHEPVFTTIEGIGASMGSLLPQAASFGCRFMQAGRYGYSQMMIHNLLWEAGRGKQSEHERHLGSALDSSVKLYSIYLRRIVEFRRVMLGETINTENEGEILYDLLRSMEERDSWMTPADTMEFGLCDFTHIDDASYEAYKKALLWYHGFRGKSVAHDEQEARVHDNPEKQYKPLDEQESAEALAEVRRLQAENFQQVHDLEAAQIDPAIKRVKQVLSEHYQNQGNRRPPRGDITRQACNEYVKVAQDNLAAEDNNDDE